MNDTPALRTFLVVPDFPSGGLEMEFFVRAATHRDAAIALWSNLNGDEEPELCEPAPKQECGNGTFVVFLVPDNQELVGVLDWALCTREDYHVE